MTHTPPSEAAASSPDHKLQVPSALPDERALQHIARSEDGYYPPAMQAMAREILRMRTQCPPTAEVEKLRHAAREENLLRLHLSNIDSALTEAGQPYRHKGDELERIHDLAAERDSAKAATAAAQDELAQLRQAIGLMTTAKPDMLVDVRDPVGMAQQVVAMVGRLKKDCLANFDASNEQKKRAEAAELDRGRHQVERDAFRRDILAASKALTDAGVEHSTLDSGIRELAGARDRLRSFAERNGKAATERGDWLQAAAKAVGCKPQDLQKECASREKMLVAFMHAGRLRFGVDIEPQMLALAAEVEEFRSSAHRDACMAIETFLRRCGVDMVKAEGLTAPHWTIAAAKCIKRSGGNGGPEAILELVRLRKESKRDQVAKQQAIINEIARLFPGKGPLLERVRRVAAAAEKRRNEVRDLISDDDVREVLRKAGAGSGFASGLALLERRPSYEFDPSEPVCHQENLLPKVAPATGQPRTEVPIGPDGSGTVVELGVELGEGFRRNLANAVDCLPSDGHPIEATTVKIAIRNLHAAVAELAKVVEWVRSS